MAQPIPNEINMGIIQAAIDRRQAGGVTPQLEQQTGAAAAPGAGPAPSPEAGAGVDPQALLAERAAGGATAPTPSAESTPEDAAETKIIVKLLVERLRKLL